MKLTGTGKKKRRTDQETRCMQCKDSRGGCGTSEKTSSHNFAGPEWLKQRRTGRDRSGKEEGREQEGRMVRACLQKAEDAQTHTRPRRQQALSALQPVMCIYPPPPAGSSQCGMASTATKPTRQPTTTSLLLLPRVKDPTFSQDEEGKLGKPLLFSFTSICRKKTACHPGALLLLPAAAKKKRHY